MSFIDDILGLGGSDNNEEENTEGSGGLNPLGLAAIAGGFFAGRNSSSAPGANTEMGYQGQIPDYNLVREQVLDTYDPDRVPGSRGQRYFSDIRYVPTGEDTANVRQQLFDQANVGLRS